MWLLERTELGVCIALVELLEEKCGNHRSIGMLGYDCHPCHHFGDSIPQIMLNLGSGVPEYHIFLDQGEAILFDAGFVSTQGSALIQRHQKQCHPDVYH